jgi:hypothetical protein
VTFDKQDILRGSFNFTSVAAPISSTGIGTGPWRVLFIGVWANNVDGGGLAMPALIQEATTAAPTLTIGSVTITVSTNGSHQIQVATGANIAAFTGTIFVFSDTIGVAGTKTIATKGSIDLGGTLTQINGIATAGNGVVAIHGSTSQKAESAADTNVLTFTPPALAGSYRLRFTLAVSAAAAAVVGWTATWKDSNGNAKSPTNLALFQAGATAGLTFTTSTTDNFYGEAQIDIDNSATNIVVKFTLGSGTITAKASASIERVQ